jgi:predicted naringenin-chalcone synthase
MEVYDAVARKLAHDAATAALHDSQVAPGDITHLVTFSCTGFAAPGWEISLITDLGLPPSTQRLHLGFMGCHAGINALSCAQALWQADPSRTILLVGVELCSLHYQPGLSRDVILPNSLFGDGAAAAVIGNSTSVGASPTLELLATGSHHIPNSEKAMSWQIGDAGFRMTLDASVPDLIKASLRKAMQELVSSAGARLEAIAHWAIHPGGPRILEACLQALELPDDAGAVSRAVMQSCGNMSSVTVLFVLQRLLDEGASGYVGSAAFGPGLCAEMALLRIP